MITITQGFHLDTNLYDGGHATTSYEGTKLELISLGLVTASMFPKKARQRRTSKLSHPESGNWHISLVDENTGIWSVAYYSPIDDIEFYPDCSPQHERLMKIHVRAHGVITVYKGYDDSDWIEAFGRRIRLHKFITLRALNGYGRNTGA